jgi:hypothetical protein
MAWTTPATFTSGQILTAAQMNTNVRDNTNALYDTVKLLGSLTRDTNLSVAVPNVTEIFSSDLTLTTVNGVSYRFEFYCPNLVTANGGYAEFKLTNGSGTVLTRMGTFGNVAIETACFCVAYYTATGASTTVNVALASGGSGTQTARSGNGSGDTLPNMWLRVYGPDLS